MRKWSLTAALAFGVVFGFACADQEDRPLSAEVEDVCQAFCDRAIECDEDLVVGDGRNDCLRECYGKADECDDVGELNEGLNELRDCSRESCSSFTTCSIDVDIDCLL